MIDRLFGDTPLEDPESTSLISPTSRSTSIPSKIAARRHIQSVPSPGILNSIKSLFGGGVKLEESAAAGGGGSTRGRERDGHAYEIVERSEGEN